MEITEEQYARIKDSLPVQRGNVRLTNLQVLNAILYVAEQGCKWRGLPKRFGRWHTIYTRMNRWAKNALLDRVLEKLQLEKIVRIRIEALSLDSTSVKVQPDGTGALKKWPPGYWQIPWWMEHQDSYGCRGCSNGHSVCFVARPRARCAARARVAGRVGSYAGGPPIVDGSRLRRRCNPTVGARSGNDSGSPAEVQPAAAMGVRSRCLQEAQRDRKIVPQAQRLPPHLLPLRKTRRRLFGVPLLCAHRRSAADSVNTP